MARAYSALSWETRGRRSAADRSVAAISVAHVAAVRLPEAAHGGLRRAGGLRLGAVAAHVDHRQRVGRGGGAALDEAADAAVLHRHVAGGADEVRLAEAPLAHLR